MVNISSVSTNKDLVVDMKFCKVSLQDNKNYPWIILTPRNLNSEYLENLTMEEKLQFMREISLCNEVFRELFKPEKIIISILEGKVNQLQAHMIALTDEEICWEKDCKNQVEDNYSETDKKRIIFEIKRSIMIKSVEEYTAC